MHDSELRSTIRLMNWKLLRRPGAAVVTMRIRMKKGISLTGAGCWGGNENEIAFNSNPLCMMMSCVTFPRMWKSEGGKWEERGSSFLQRPIITIMWHFSYVLYWGGKRLVLVRHFLLRRWFWGRDAFLWCGYMYRAGRKDPHCYRVQCVFLPALYVCG